MAQITLTLEQAVATVREAAAGAGRRAAEWAPLTEALGRRLAGDVLADGPWPTTDRSAMDGFALAAAGGAAAGARFPVVGASLAGAPFAGAVGAGDAIRIMTGGVVPAGATAVVPVEDTVEGFADGAAITLAAAVAAGANIRRRGSEVAAGDLLLADGTRLRSAEIGALAVLGRDPVPVYARPTVAILATGDEVVDIGEVPADHQVRNSNAWALAAQVREAGAVPEVLGIARDEVEALRRLLRRGLAHADVLITIGGVSKGTHDLVHGTLRDLGVEPRFHGVRLKPGKPTFFGVVPGTPPRHVFGLPGNPASCYTTFDLFVAPLLAALGGGQAPASHPARPGGAPCRRNQRTQAVPARRTFGPDGVAVAELTRVRPSGDPFSLLAADGYAVVDPEVDPQAQATVRFVPYGAGPA